MKGVRNQPPGKAPNPSDLERPAPNEPVRIQPPAPQFAETREPSTTRRPSSHDEETEPPNVDESARQAEMTRERERLRNDPERRRGFDRKAVDPNRWVHQRAVDRGRWQTHGHSSLRGR